MKARPLIRLMLPLFILALAVAVAYAMVSSKTERKRAKPSEKVWQVDVMKAEVATLAPGLILYGQVESSALLKVAAPGAGVIAELAVQPGDAVRSGQQLLAMDQRDFEAERQQAQAEVDDMQAQLAELSLRHQANVQALQQEKALLQLAQKEVRRVERLKNKNLSSDSALSNAHETLGRQKLAVIARQLEVDRFEAAKKQLQARLARARARLQQAQLASERSKVVAGFDGVVSEVGVAKGDRVRAGDRLMTLYALDSLQIRAPVPVRYQHEIQQALSTGATLSAQADLAGQSIELKLSRLAGAASLSSIDGYFSIGRGGEVLRQGNLIKLELLRPPQSNVVAVPFSAIYGNNRIFVLRDGRMVALDVESVGQYKGNDGESLLLVRNAQIQSADQIIITHLPNAVDGLKVKVAKD